MKTVTLLASACLLASGFAFVQVATAQAPTAATAPPAAQSTDTAPAPAPTIAPSPTAEEMRQPRPPRARGISTALAVEAAQTAIATCLANTYKTTALVVDAAGVPIALISGDGAAAITQRVAMGKAQSVLRYKTSSGEVATKARADAALMSQLTADPLIGTPRQGAIPIMIGAELVGAISISGAPGGDKDEPCATAGVAKIRDRLK